MDISTFIAKWKDSAASERANKDSFLNDLCDALSVPRPDPKTGDPERDRYVFERDAVLVHGGERHSIGWIDLYKHGCFILEAKQGSEAESKKIGTARRGTPVWNIAMQEAFEFAAIRDLVSTNGGAQEVWSVERAAAAFKGSRKKDVESILESLAALGLLIAFDTAEGKRWRAVAYSNA